MYSLYKSTKFKTNQRKNEKRNYLQKIQRITKNEEILLKNFVSQKVEYLKRENFKRGFKYKS